MRKKCIKNTVLKRIPSDMEVAPPPFNRFSQLSNYKRLKIKVTKMEYFIGFAVHYFPPVKETPLFNISSKRDQVLQISLDQCFECTTPLVFDIGLLPLVVGDFPSSLTENMKISSLFILAKAKSLKFRAHFSNL